MLRRPLKIRRSGYEGVVKVYDLEYAKQAHDRIEKINLRDLYTAGKVTTLPYPGTGLPPRRPGGEIEFIGRTDLEQFLHLVADSSASVVVFAGPCGIGKSCLLRAMVCCLMRDAIVHKRMARVIFIGDLNTVIYQNDLLACVKRALRFTYCKNDEDLSSIGALEIMEDVNHFLREKKATAGEGFLVVIDQAEMLDTSSSVGEEVEQKEKRMRFKKDVDDFLVPNADLVVYGVSTRAGITKDYDGRTDGQGEIVFFEDGFEEEQLDAFKSELSVLGEICSKYPEREEVVRHYAGRHPLSLALLDRCCRRYASSKTVARDVMGGSILANRGSKQKELSKEETVECLRDSDDWEAALETFLDCSELSGIRSSLVRALSFIKPETTPVTVEDMAKVDTRFIVGNSEDGYEFVTGHIQQLYTEVFREFQKSEKVTKTPEKKKKRYWPGFQIYWPSTRRARHWIHLHQTLKREFTDSVIFPLPAGSEQGHPNHCIRFKRNGSENSHSFVELVSSPEHIDQAQIMLQTSSGTFEQESTPPLVSPPAR